jgi:prolyl-tRNA synthetase
VLLDTKAAKASNKRWSWVKKGAPIIVEVGPRDVGEGKAAILRRDRLYKDDGKLATAFTPRGEFVAAATGLLEDIQSTLYAEAKERLDANIRRDVTDLASHFAGDEAKFAGWVEVQWARPTGAALDKIVEQLKALKLTMRNSPIDAAAVDGACFFTGEPAVERILIGRTY